MWKKIIVGLSVGFISGMFASGGGLLLIPAYIFLFNSSEKEARATTIFCILPMVITTAFFYGTRDYINLKVGLLCALGGIVGSFIGSKLLNILKGKYLKVIFIIFLFYSGIRLIFF
ncbi:MAG: sulfite exporter TauE/SafE family protein [Clostridia bacterium]